MKNIYFLDTSYILSLEIKNDSAHQQVLQSWATLAISNAFLVTTTYIFDEVVTFFNSRSLHYKAVEVGNRLLESRDIELIEIDRTLFNQGWLDLWLLKSRGHDPGFLGLCRFDSTAVWPTKTVPVQDLRVTDIDHARIIEEKLNCNLIRNILGHIPIRGQHLELYIRRGVRNAGLSRRTHVATAFTASFHHRITGRPGFIDNIGDLFQQNLFRDDDKFFGWLGHVG